MTAPNQIAPMPEPGGEPADTGPRFNEPRPSLVERTSMKIAGAALGLGFKADPSTTLETLVTKVGGYTPETHGGRQTKTFVKDTEKAQYRPALQDETTKGGNVRHHETAADFTQETSGLFLGDAARRVSSGQVARDQHLKLRERAARSLVGKSMRRGQYGHLQPKQD